MTETELEKQKVIEELKKYDIFDILNLEWFTGETVSMNLDARELLYGRSEINKVFDRYSKQTNCYPEKLFVENYLKNKEKLDAFDYTYNDDNWRKEPLIGLNKEDLHYFYFKGMDIYNLTELLRFVQWKLGEKIIC